MGQALARLGTPHGTRGRPKVLDSGAVSPGYQYRSSAADGDPRPLPPLALTGQPGSRAHGIAS